MNHDISVLCQTRLVAKLRSPVIC